MLEQISEKIPLRADNADELVAIGAAIQASLEKSLPENVIPGKHAKIMDVTSQSLGIIALNEMGTLCNSIIIKHNQKIPVSESKIFNTVNENQVEIKIDVTQGDDEDPEYVRFVTKEGGQIFTIPPYPAGAPIKVTFHYDIDQTIQVEVYDLTANQSLGKFEIDNVANLNYEQVTVAREKNKKIEVR
jgi:molecular chaperone DnaK